MRNFQAGKMFLGMALIAGIWCGCGRDVRLAGAKMRSPKVKAVSHFGLTLDQSATPEQVAYVALRAIRDDVLATTPQDREAALDIQFDVAAADVIAARNKTSLSRDEYIHHVVSRWAPTVSHYAAQFETDAVKAVAQFRNRGSSRSSESDIAECELAMEVSEPGGAASGRILMLVWLAKDSGFWRVMHLGFEPRKALTSSANSAPKPEGS